MIDSKLLVPGATLRQSGLHVVQRTPEGKEHHVEDTDLDDVALQVHLAGYAFRHMGGSLEITEEDSP